MKSRHRSIRSTVQVGLCALWITAGLAAAEEPPDVTLGGQENVIHPDRAEFEATARRQRAEAAKDRHRATEAKLWRMVGEQRFVEADDTLQRLRIEDPDYEPPAGLIDLIERFGHRQAADRALESGDSARLLDLAEAHPEIFGCDRIDLLWGLGAARAGRSVEEGARVYRRILRQCRRADPIATVQKASAHLSPTLMRSLFVDAERGGATPPDDLAAVRKDYFWGLVTEALKQEDDRTVVAHVREVDAALREARDAGLAEAVAWTYHRGQHSLEAAEWFERALDWQPTRADAAYGLALTRLDLDDPDGVDALIARFPNHPGLAGLPATLRSEEAEDAFRHGDFLRTIAVLESARLDRTLDRGLRKLLAWSYAELGHCDRALGEFDALHREHAEAETLQGLVRCLRAERDHAALAVLLDSDTLPPDIVREHLATEIGWQLLDDGDDATARRWFERALRWRADTEDAAYGLAELELRAGDAHQVVELYRRFPDSSRIRATALRAILHLARAAHDAGEWLETLTWLDRYRTGGGVDRGADLLEAWSLLRLDRLDDACARFASVHAARPDDEALRGLLHCEAGRDNWPAVARLARRAERLLERRWHTTGATGDRASQAADASLAAVLGWSAYHQGDAHSADLWFRRALAFDATQTDAAYGRALTAYESGARDLLDELTRRYPDDARIHELSRRLWRQRAEGWPTPSESSHWTPPSRADERYPTTRARGRDRDRDRDRVHHDVFDDGCTGSPGGSRADDWTWPNVEPEARRADEGSWPSDEPRTRRDPYPTDRESWDDPGTLHELPARWDDRVPSERLPSTLPPRSARPDRGTTVAALGRPTPASRTRDLPAPTAAVYRPTSQPPRVATPPRRPTPVTAEPSRPRSRADERGHAIHNAWHDYRDGRLDRAAERFTRLYRDHPDAESAEGLYFSYKDRGRHDELARLSREVPGPLSEWLRRRSASDHYQRKQFLASESLAPGALGQLDNITASAYTTGASRREKTGEPGLGELRQERLPLVHGRFTMSDRVEMRIWADSVVLDAGRLPAGALVGSGRTDAPRADRLTSVDVGFEPRIVLRRDGWVSPYLEVGTTPSDGAVDAAVVGRVGVVRQTVPGSWRVEAYSEPVRESILSYTGLTDPFSGSAWGRVLRHGLSLTSSVQLSPHWGSYLRLGGERLRGEQVADNDRVYATLSLDRSFTTRQLDYFTAGPYLNLDRYEKNLGRFTFGHGGYFSPQRFTEGGFAAQIAASEGHRWWFGARVGVGYQRHTKEDSPYFPLSPDGQIHPGEELEGWAGTLDLKGLWRVNRQMAIGAGFSWESSPRYDATSSHLFFTWTPSGRSSVFSTDRPTLALDRR
ncbi:MAG: cellulose synthase subunit BcsC-related outer membrane protein [Acidobacteriota bacterium]